MLNLEIKACTSFIITGIKNMESSIKGIRNMEISITGIRHMEISITGIRNMEIFITGIRDQNYGDLYHRDHISEIWRSLSQGSKIWRSR